MKIGIISDTHDRLDKIDKSINIFNQKEVELILHAGDFISPFALKRFSKLHTKLIGVYGNNDGDILTLKQIADKFGFEIYNSPRELVIGNKNAVIMHEPLFISYLKDFDLVVYGHTHHLDIQSGHPIIINPGDASGWLGKSTIVILDLETMQTEVINL